MGRDYTPRRIDAGRPGNNNPGCLADLVGTRFLLMTMHAVNGTPRGGGSRHPSQGFGSNPHFSRKINPGVSGSPNKGCATGFLVMALGVLFWVLAKGRKG